MIDSGDMPELVSDALMNRRMGGGTCLVSNQAGAQLLAAGNGIVSAIEDIVRSTILPTMEMHVEKHGIADPEAMFREGPPFGGLKQVLGAYWVQCALSEPSRAIQFMQEMPSSVASEAILSLVTFFNPSRSFAKVSLPAEYAQYLKHVNESPVPEMRRLATYALKRLELDQPGV